MNTLRNSTNISKSLILNKPIENIIRIQFNPLIQQINEYELDFDSFKATQTLLEKELNQIYLNEEDVLNNYIETKNKFLDMKIQLEEAKMTVDNFKKLLEKEKEDKKLLEITLNKRYEEELKKQKEEYEKISEGHLKFIDQLVNDKRELNNQCEIFINQLKESNIKQLKFANETKEKFQRELKSNKDKWIANELKIREKWEKYKTSLIKELTIRGIEPELDRIMKKGKEELKKAEEKFENEKEKYKDEIAQEYDTKIKNFKEKLIKEHEESVNIEREFLINKYKTQLDNMEKKYQEDLLRIKKAYGS